jgi:Mrp family chromosome partitioning ATPase
MLCMIATTVTTFFLPDVTTPDSYTATLRIQITLPPSQMGSIDTNATTLFYASLFTRDITLAPLVSKYKAKYPGVADSDVFAALQTSVVTVPIVNTNYFQLSATPSFVNANASDATALVNDVFAAGVKELRLNRNALVTRLTTALDTELQQNQDALSGTIADMTALSAANQTDTFVYLEDESLYKAQVNRVTALHKQLQVLQQQQLLDGSLLHVASGNADLLTTVSSPPTQGLRYAFSPLIGLVMGIGGAYIASMFSTRLPVRGKKRDLMLPHVIATIPLLSGARTHQLDVLRKSSPCTPLFRHLRYQAREHEQTLAVITITGPRGREGKSFVAAGLAIAAAQNGLRTILVDANPRHPVQHIWFQTAPASGVLNVVESLTAGGTPASPVQPTFHPYLGLLPIGTKQTSADSLSEDLPVNGLHALTSLLHSQADLIIFDGPSLLDDANAANMVQVSDRVLLIVNEQSSQSSAVLEAENVLSTLGVPSATILNRATGDREE